MKTHTQAERIAKIVKMLTSGPHTVVEIVGKLDLPVTCTNRHTVGRVLYTLQDHGLVRIVGSRAPTGRGGRGWLWAWVGNK